MIIFSLYEQKFTKTLTSSIFTLITAFSRERPGNKHKVYVQNRLAENGKLINSLLQTDKANFYVCGDAANMARDVNSTLCKIIAEERGISEQKAEEIVKGMRASGQYQEDVWS